MTGKQLKNSILQWAIQGKLVPQDPNDEPASELLERIRAEKTRLVKKGKIKKDKNESIIYRGEDNSYYEKNLASNVVKCIDDEIPFEIPKQWIWCRLGSIVAVYGGKRIPVGESLSKIDTGHKYIRVSDMKNNSVKTDDIHFISESIYQRIKAYTISKDDIYITVAGTIGSIGEIPAELDGANLTENADKLVFNGLSRHFMMYALMSDLIQNQIRECTTKVGQPKLAIIRIQRLLFALPPINEQNRIADRIELIIPIANKYEKLQLNKNKLNTAIIDELKKSILQEAIQGKLVPQDPSEGTAEVLITQINANKQYLVNQGVLKKSSAIGSTISKGSDGKYYEIKNGQIIDISKDIIFDIPASWRWIRLGDLAKLSIGKTPPRGKTEYWSDGQYNWVSISDMTDYGFVRKTKEKVSEQAISIMGQISPRGTLLMSFKLTIGRTSLLEVPAYHNEAIVSIYPYIDYSVLRDYLFRILPIISVSGESKDAIKGKTLNSNSLFNLLIPLPPLEEQQLIITKLDTLFESLK